MVSAADETADPVETAVRHLVLELRDDTVRSGGVTEQHTAQLYGGGARQHHAENVEAGAGTARAPNAGRSVSGSISSPGYPVVTTTASAPLSAAAVAASTTTPPAPSLARTGTSRGSSWRTARTTSPVR